MKLKYIVAGALIVFAVIVSSLFIANFANRSTENAQNTTENSTSSDQPESSGNNQSTDDSSFTAEEVAGHATTSDCWIIIRNNVYDVTSFINSHPGGVDRIAGQCGKDATTAFESQGGEGSHSSDARSRLESLKIGTLQ